MIFFSNCSFFLIGCSCFHFCRKVFYVSPTFPKLFFRWGGRVGWAIFEYGIQVGPQRPAQGPCQTWLGSIQKFRRQTQPKPRKMSDLTATANCDMVNVSSNRSLCILTGCDIGGVTHSFNNKHQFDLNRHPMCGHNAIGFNRKWKYTVPGSWAWENPNTRIPEREIKHKNNPLLWVFSKNSVGKRSWYFFFERKSFFSIINFVKLLKNHNLGFKKWDPRSQTVLNLTGTREIKRELFPSVLPCDAAIFLGLCPHS